MAAHEPPLSLYLVRHGQTPWSLSGQHTGRTDLALTVEGEAEAMALEPWLRPIAFSHVLTSPLNRARRTAALASPMVQAVVESDLREVDYGDYEGRTSKDIKSVSPGWSLFRDGSPGGETPLDMTARADRLIARLNTLKGPVALFSHGHFSCVLATRWIGLPVAEAEHFSLSTASLSLLSYSPSHPEVPVIRLWNASPAVLYSG